MVELPALVITGATDGGLWPMRTVFLESVLGPTEETKIKKVIFDVLNGQVGDLFAGAHADEALNELARHSLDGVFTDWAHEEEADETGGSVGWWISVIFLPDILSEKEEEV